MEVRKEKSSFRTTARTLCLNLQSYINVDRKLILGPLEKNNMSCSSFSKSKFQQPWYKCSQYYSLLTTVSE